VGTAGLARLNLGGKYFREHKIMINVEFFAPEQLAQMVLESQSKHQAKKGSPVKM